MNNDSICYFWSHPSVFLVSGPSAERYLHGRCTQDIKSLKDGELRWSLILNPQGRVEGKFLIGRSGEEFYIFSDQLETKSLEDDFLKALLRFKVADQFEIVSIGANVCRLSLYIKSSSEEYSLNLFAEKFRNKADILKFKLVATGYSEELLLFSELSCSLEELRQALTSEISLCEMDDYNRFRIEQMIPQMNVDIDTTILAPDFPLENFITVGKGCYAGQEVVEMATARGRPNRKLIKIKSDSKILNIDRNLIFAGDSEIGHVSSGMNFDKNIVGFIGLGFIKNKPYESLEFLIQDETLKVPASISDV